MPRILIVGATGVTILRNLPADLEVTAALRDPADANRFAQLRASLDHVFMDITNSDSLRQAMRGVWG
ncbi:Rossmann-fold NAD(P)-binding domain-containing protein [Brevibacterium aurantiacum]|uniref:hypothetical protein n=1 Tax=Brevibacterium aurantiacum TaxID=273384 RepID=UPI001868D912|nr:hypothetical protein [Brevibacterium aurantiacum]